MRKIFFEKLKEKAKDDKNIFLLVGDLGAKFFNDFLEIDKKRFINAGVAEGNMIGTAAGLSMSGKNVFCYSIIPFLIMRSFEQIRVDVCFNNLNVKLLGAGGGLVYGAEGITHHAIEDIALMRSLPNMTVVCPGDRKEAECLVKEIIDYKGPVYVRFGRDFDPLVHEGDINFKIGRGITVKEGKDICLITTGTMLHTGKAISDILEKENITCNLISMHTVKPLDEELVKKTGKSFNNIFTLEDHSIIGGLGSAVSEVLLETGYQGKFKRFGIRDNFCQLSGKSDYLLKSQGLDSETIAANIKSEIK